MTSELGRDISFTFSGKIKMSNLNINYHLIIIDNKSFSGKVERKSSAYFDIMTSADTSLYYDAKAEMSSDFDSEKEVDSLIGNIELSHYYDESDYMSVRTEFKGIISL